MASQAPNLPLLYNNIVPLNRNEHANLKVRRTEGMPAVGVTHAIPLTVDEFALAQRFYPIVFSLGDNPVPLALLGLHEGTNTFFDASGTLREPSTYIPAYLRRYPFFLARLNEGSDELSLCFDPTSETISETEGDPLFANGEATDTINTILQFCEQFEQAGLRTTAFIQALKDADLLMDGEVAIQPDGADQPAIYRGFQMVDEDKFRELRGDELRKLNQNGGLALIMAHLFSLATIREVFGRHVAQGTGPQGASIPVPAEA